MLPVLELQLLGPLLVRREGREVGVSAPKQRALLIRLAIDAGHVVSMPRLTEDLWDGDPPPRAEVSLRSYVSHLRRLLAADAGEDGSIVTRGHGYTLAVEPGGLDTVRFEALLGRARLARPADPVLALKVLDEALELWRGEPLLDVAYHQFAQATIARFTELRLSAEEDRHELLLALGRHADTLPFLEAAVAEHPLRERRQRHLMVGLYRAGRAPDALAVHRRFRALLADELGLDPSPDLDALANDILRQAPGLGGPPRVPAASVRAVAPVDPGPGATAASRPDDVRLEGRDAELGRLCALLDRLPSAGAVALVSGDPGIGKTALLEVAASVADRRGAAVRWGRCHELPGAPALWPWTQLVRSAVEGADDGVLRGLVADRARPVCRLAPEIADRLGLDIDGGIVDAELARFTLYEAVTTFLIRAAGPRGCLLLLEDLHWADTESAHLLAYFAAQVATAPIVVFVSLRGDEAERASELAAVLATVSRERHTVAVELGGLSEEAVTALVRSTVGRELAEPEVRSVLDRSGGNPFFVQQLALLLDQLAPADSGTPLEQLGIPPGVRHVINRRLQALDEPARELLEAAAVLGREFHLRILRDVIQAPPDAALEAMDGVVEVGLVAPAPGPAGGYRFVHSLVRETIQAGLTPGREARLHARLLTALETRTSAPVDQLAEHAWRAADLLDSQRSVHYARAAADEAIRRMAYGDAERHLRRALHLHDRAGSGSGDASTELAVRLRLIQVLTSTRGWRDPEIEQVAGRVRALSADVAVAPDLVPLWWTLWTFYMTHGDLDASSQLAHGLLDKATENGNPACRVAGHVAVAYSSLFRGAAVTEVLEHLARARDLESAADPTRLAGTAEHLGVALRVSEAVAHALGGDVASALAAGEEAVRHAADVAGPFARAYAHLFGALAAAIVDRPDEALAHGEAGLALCAKGGFQHAAQLTIPAHAWAAARLGDDPQEQAERIAGSVAWLRSVGHAHVLPQWHLLLAEVRLLAGDRTGAFQAMAAAAEVERSTGEAVYGGQTQRLRERLDVT